MKALRKVALAFLVVAAGICGVPHAAEPAKHNVVPKDGYVPNAETAISIAVAVWSPIYGHENIERQKPFQAALNSDGIWVVTGSLPKGWRGGVALAEIAKSDGRIVRVCNDPVNSCSGVTFD